MIVRHDSCTRLIETRRSIVPFFTYSHCEDLARCAASKRSRSFHERLSSRPVRFSSRLPSNYESKLNFEADLEGFARRGFEFHASNKTRYPPNAVFIPDFRTKIVWTLLDQFHSRRSDFFFFFLNCRIQSDSRRYLRYRSLTTITQSHNTDRKDQIYSIFATSSNDP